MEKKLYFGKFVYDIRKLDEAIDFHIDYLLSIQNTFILNDEDEYIKPIDAEQPMLIHEDITCVSTIYCHMVNRFEFRTGAIINYFLNKIQNLTHYYDIKFK